MAKKKSEAASAAVEPEAPAVEADPGKPGELSAGELAAVLRSFHWSDDTSKEKAGAALVERFSVFPRPPKAPPVPQETPEE